MLLCNWHENYKDTICQLLCSDLLVLSSGYNIYLAIGQKEFSIIYCAN